MTEHTLHVDLSPILSAVHAVERQVGDVDLKLDSMALETGELRSRLEQFHDEFLAYVRLDELRNELQLAETRLVKVRQELEVRFGHYAEVRRRAVGILQATDVTIVREETMRSATEELMLATPRYWLAPTLVSLTAWISDRKELSERALAEALRRDANKACLFFALVCRRASRLAALSIWLEAYLSIQDPTALDREVVVLLDALAGGLFGGAALAASRQVTDRWLVEFEAQSGFLAEQTANWSKALSARQAVVEQGAFPALRKYSPTWPRLEASLSGVLRNGILLDHFRRVFEGDLEVPMRLSAAVDELLDSLTGRFDDEELPLRREERLLSLIVEAEGNRDAAERRMRAEEQTFAEKTTFVAILTSAAMTPEPTGASKATQRYAIATSRSWILAAHQQLVASDRANAPIEVEIGMGTWRGTSRDGLNEADLTASIDQHYAAKKQSALASLGFGLFGVVAFILAGLGGISLLVILSERTSSSPVAPIAFFALAGLAWFLDINSREGRRRKAIAGIEQEEKGAKQFLSTILRELAAYREAWQRSDAKAKALQDLLEGLSPISRRAVEPELTGKVPA